MFGKARYLPLVAWAALAGATPGSAIAGDPTPPPRPTAPAAPAAPAAPVDPLAARFPEAQLDDKALCDRLLARTAADAVFVDPEPRARRKVIVSDLHLGPGHQRPAVRRHRGLLLGGRAGPLPRAAGRGRTDRSDHQRRLHRVLADRRRAGRAAQAHRPPAADEPERCWPPTSASRSPRSSWCSPRTARCSPTSASCSTRGDNRVIIVAGNHDADLLWPKVQLAIARAIKPRDPSRLIFTPGPSYEHARRPRRARPRLRRREPLRDRPRAVRPRPRRHLPPAIELGRGLRRPVLHGRRAQGAVHRQPVPAVGRHPVGDARQSRPAARRGRGDRLHRSAARRREPRLQPQRDRRRCCRARSARRARATAGPSR